MAELPSSSLDLLQGNFSAGELSPRMLGRSDYDRYQHGAAVLENWRVLAEGGLTKRPSTRLVAVSPELDHPPVLVPFIFRAADAMILEFGNLLMRAYKQGAVVPGVSVDTPYTWDEVFQVRTAQKNDLTYLTHIAHAPRQLERFADDDWALSDVTFRPPPTAERGVKPATTLTLSATSGTGITATAGAAAFTRSDLERQITVPGGRAIIRTFTSSTVVLVDIVDPFPTTAYAAGTWTLAASPVANLKPSKSGPPGASVTLSLRTSSFINLIPDGDFTTGLGAWVDESTGTGAISASTGVVTLNGGAGPGQGGVFRQVDDLVVGATYVVTWDALSAPSAIYVFSFPASDTLVAYQVVAVGLARQAIFVATETSATIHFTNGANTNAIIDNVALRLQKVEGWRTTDADGNHYVALSGGLVHLTAYVNAIDITGEILEPLTTDAEVVAGDWTLETGVFSVLQGFPALCKFSDLRLLLASSPDFPQTIWGSVTDDFENFRKGTKAADGFFYTLAQPRGWLRWLQPAKQLLVGAESGEFRLIGPNDGALTAAEPPQVDPFGTFGSAEVDPLFIGTSVLFAQLQGSKLRESTFNFDLGSLEGEDLTRLSGHLLGTQADGSGVHIVQMAYQQEPISTVWMVRSDGVLLGMTYDRKEGIKGWYRMVSPNGLFRSVATIPHPTRNETQVWVVVERVLNGDTRYCIEILDETLYGVDSAVTGSGAPTMTLTGLSHLDGQTVHIAGRLVGDTALSTFPPQGVAGGVVTIPAPVTSWYAGLGWTPRAAKLPPEMGSFPAGRTSLGLKPKQWRQVFVRVLETGSGLTLNGTPLALRVMGEPMDRGPALVSGLLGPMTHLGWSFDAPFILEHAEPLPATILSCGGTLEVGED